METKKIEYLKKHLIQALAEENYGDANYCFKELSSIPNVDVSEFATAVSNLNAKYKSKINENSTPDFEKLKEQIRHEKKNLNIVSKIQVWGLAGGFGLLPFAVILILLSSGEIIDDYYDDNLMYFGAVIGCLGCFGILVGTVFLFINNKVYKPVNDTRRKLFNELCSSQEKFKYLDNVEIINGYGGLPQYMGQVANGKKEGFGISVDPYGYFYVGEWLNGEKSGIGKLMTDDFKMVLEGEFLSDYANGIIDITWEDGSEWHGEYKKGFPTIPVLTNQDFVVTAYEGWQLSLTSSAQDGWVDSLTVSEESNDGRLEFYVRHKDSGAVSEKITEPYKIDKTPPVISGAEDGKFYYEDITLTAADDNFLHFRTNGIPYSQGNTVLVLTVNEEANWDTVRVSAVDKANNYTTVTIYNGHYWSEWLSNGDGTHTRTSKLYENNTLTDNCHGGTANCRSGAVCEDCKTAYGAPDPDNHTNLRHFPAKAATKKAEGNIEYWYCDGCGRYFADEDGTKELQKADVVIEKLKDNTVSPPTGDLGNPAGVIALMCISVIIIIFTTIISMMKQHFKR